MSGLLVRFGGPLAKMVFRDASSKHTDDLYRPLGPTDCLAPWIDLILPSTPLAAPAQPVARTRPTDLLSGGSHRCLGHPRAVVTLACRHQLPGDAGGLVGQRHCRLLRRLALDQFEQPARSAMMLPGRLLDHRGRPDHEKLTQSLVAGTGYL